MGYDNAHGVPHLGGKYARRRTASIIGTAMKRIRDGLIGLSTQNG